MRRVFLLACGVCASFAPLAQADDPKPNPQPVVKEKQPPLVGRWVAIYGTEKWPGTVQIVNIDPDGTFTFVTLSILPTESEAQNQKQGVKRRFPVQSEVKDCEQGWIDLKTGLQKITPEMKKLSVKSITWCARGDRLQWYRDMGGMGGEVQNFCRVDPAYEIEPFEPPPSKPAEPAKAGKTEAGKEKRPNAVPAKE